MKKNAIEIRPAYWAATAYNFRLGPLDGYALYPIAIFLVHIRWWTFWTLVAVLILNAILNHMGFTLPVLFRYLKTVVGGRVCRRRPGIGRLTIWH